MLGSERRRRCGLAATEPDDLGNDRLGLVDGDCGHLRSEPEIGRQRQLFTVTGL
jgi:hypothetical protein